MRNDDTDGKDTQAPLSIEQQPIADVFGVLASELRIEILEALGDPPGVSKSFSTLYKEVPAEDSGNFTYHLNELLGSFVREESDKYILSTAGEQVCGAIQAGKYSATASVEPMYFGGECQLCDGGLLFEYAQEMVQVYCDGCGSGRSFRFPPGQLPEYPVEELPAVSARWYRTTVKRVLDGFCPVCAGQMSGGLLHGVDTETNPPEPSMASFRCESCGKTRRLSGATIATFHPVFEGFLFEHGFDTRARPHSEVWAGLDETSERTNTRDPLTVEVTFTHNNEQVTGLLNTETTMTKVKRQHL